MKKEMAIKLARKEIEAKRDFCGKAEALCDMVRKFNGKVFNKRLETAMREIYPVSIEQGYTWKSITMKGWVYDRMVQSDDLDESGYHKWTAYIKNDTIYFGTIRDAFDDDKRIIAENIIKAIRDNAEYLRKSADVIEEQLNRIDEIDAEYQRIENERKKFLHDVNGTLMDYFGWEV